MKKILIFLAVIITAFGLTLPLVVARAQTRDIVESPIKSPNKDNKQVFDDKIYNGEMGLLKRVAHAIKKLFEIHVRLTSLSNRIEERINKITASALSANSPKINIPDAKKFLTAAREDLKRAKIEIDSIQKTFLSEIAPNTKTYTKTDMKLLTENVAEYVKGRLANTHSRIRSAKDALKSAHKNLVESVKNLGPVDQTNENKKMDKAEIKTIGLPNTEVNVNSTQ